MAVETLDRTVPWIADFERVPTDWLRKLLRSRPDLVALTTQIGPTRIVPAANLAEFVAAVRAARAARFAPQPAQV